jgi:hypothetical protein
MLGIKVKFKIKQSVKIVKFIDYTTCHFIRPLINISDGNAMLNKPCTVATIDFI